MTASEKYRVCNHCNLSELCWADGVPTGKSHGDALLCIRTGDVMEPDHPGCECWVDINYNTYERLVANEQKSIGQ